MVHERGIEIGQKSMKAFDEAVSPTTKIEFEGLILSEGLFQICQKRFCRFLPC